jgi:acetyltransferase-like isoleucine patch superfamily enzyme
MGAGVVHGPSELRRSVLAARLATAPGTGLSDKVLARVAMRLEGGGFRSATARDLLRRRYGVEVGAYSYGACLRPGAFPPGVTVGRYVSMANEVAVFRRNHPVERLSMHPFFYSAKVGPLGHDTIDAEPLEIGHDAWLGHQSVILPGCRRIGIGSVVGAGAIVTADVPDFAIVTGNPAQVRRRRFPDEVCDAVLESRWWERPVEDLLVDLPAMLMPLNGRWSAHPLLHAHAA